VALERDVPLTEDTRFAIRSVSYLGSDRYLMVTLGTGPRVKPAYAYEGANEALNLEETFLRLDRLVSTVSADSLRTQLKQVGAELLQGLDAPLGDFSGRLGRLSGGLDDAARGLAELNLRLDTLTARLQPGSTAGRLLGSDELYQELRQTNQELQALLADVRKNPKRYFKLSVF